MSILGAYQSDFKANLKLAWPIILGQLGQVSVNIIDNLMVGRLGATALASVALAISIFVVFLVVGIGVSMGLQPLVAEAEARGDYRRVSYSFKHSFIINVIFALLSVLAVELSIPILYHLGQEPAVVQGAIPYLRICVWSLVPMMMFQALRGLAEGLSTTAPPMIAMLIGNVVNVILNYMLIYGNWGAPELGVTGAAWGTLAARGVMFIVLLFLCRVWIRRAMLSIWDYLTKIDPKTYSIGYFKKVLGLGIPTSLQMLFEIGAFAAAAIMMGVIGEEAQAAHQITINAVSATFMVCTGLSVAATVRVGSALGRDDKVGMRKAGMVAIAQSVLFMCCTAVLITIFRHMIPALYIDNQEVISIAAGLFLIAAIFQISDGIQIAAIGALRGMQDIWWPTMVTFFAYICIGLPFSWFSTFHWGMGYRGIWIGLLIGLSLSAILNAWRFHRMSKV
jgi:MATE family multidrug resistance protein